MKNYLKLFALSFLFILSSCSKDDDQPINIGDGGAPPTDRFFVKAQVNGENYYASNYDFYTLYSSQEKLVSVNSSMEANGINQGISFAIENYRGTGIYYGVTPEEDDLPFLACIYMENEDLYLYPAPNKPVAQVNITKDANGVLEGTFEFYVQDIINGKTAEIKNGEFKVDYRDGMPL